MFNIKYFQPFQFGIIIYYSVRKKVNASFDAQSRTGNRISFIISTNISPRRGYPSSLN